MALFGRDYDRDHGMHRGWNRGYDVGFRGGSAGYDVGFRGGSPGAGYDREFGMYGRSGRYGRDMEKSRWQTDYGDPFGDRTAHTPMRMMRGPFRGYDRDQGAWRTQPRYDRGMQRDDAWSRGPWDRGYGRSYYGQGGGYDRWF